MSKPKHTAGPWAVLCIDDKMEIVPAMRDGLIATLTGDAEAEANAYIMAAAPEAVDFALFYDAHMSEQFPKGLQPSYERGLMDPKAAESWGRCKSFLTKAGLTA